MKQYGFYFDQTLCAGCHACQIACKAKNHLQPGSLLRRVRSFETGEFPHPGIYHLSAGCAHCADPACAAACPVGRISKDETNGIVACDPDIPCLGEDCLACVEACPYGHPVYDRLKKEVVKCGLCRDLLQNGEQPACIASCMMRALAWGPVDELKARYGPGLVTALPCLPDGGTGPHLLIRARECAGETSFEEKRM